MHRVVLRKTLNLLTNFSAVCCRKLRDPLYHVALLCSLAHAKHGLSGRREMILKLELFVEKAVCDAPYPLLQLAIWDSDR